MASLIFKHVTTDIDRHGNVRYYFRRRGVKGKIRLPGLPGSAEFMAAYAAALGGYAPPAQATRPLTNLKRSNDTLEWLCNQYLHSPEFRETAKAANTKRAKRSAIKGICSETLDRDGAGPRLGDLPYADLTERAVRMLRDRKSDTPTAANAYVKQLSLLFRWAISAKHATENPARDVPCLKISSDGFHTWTMAEVRQYEASHPVGSQARLALALYMFTGARKSDVIRLGPQHRAADDWFRFTAKKNETRTPVQIEIPVLPELSRIIAATPCGHLVYLVNERGKPWTDSSFGKKFHEWCAHAGLPHCSAHGLRKAAACAAAENGATEMQMMAIFGWKTPDMARVYTRKAERSKMAGASMHLVTNRQNKDHTNVSHFDSTLRSGGTQTAKKD